ncbi:hypothetical protein METHPM2_110010 [Pseudomonas sp. PM2]
MPLTSSFPATQRPSGLREQARQMNVFEYDMGTFLGMVANRLHLYPRKGHNIKQSMSQKCEK